MDMNQQIDISQIGIFFKEKTQWVIEDFEKSPIDEKSAYITAGVGVILMFVGIFMMIF